MTNVRAATHALWASQAFYALMYFVLWPLDWMRPVFLSIYFPAAIMAVLFSENSQVPNQTIGIVAGMVQSFVMVFGAILLLGWTTDASSRARNDGSKPGRG